MTTYTNAEIRGAILRAADVYEAFPYTSIAKTRVPPLGEHGCPLSIVARELGAEVGMSCDAFLIKHAGFAFIQLDDWVKSTGKEFPVCQHGSKAAQLLRDFADAKFPAAVVPPSNDCRALVRWEDCAWRPAQVMA